MNKLDTYGTGLVVCIAFLNVLIFLPTSAAAHQSGLSISFRPEIADYDAIEYRFGSVFNHEYGTLTGMSLRGEYTWGGWSVGLLQRSVSGLIDYQGQTSLGLPVQSRTNLRYSQFGLSTTYEFKSLPVYVGLAWRTRKVDRFIEPTAISQALHETLRQNEWGPIIGARWQAGNKLTADVRLLALVTTSSSLAVDFLGSYDAGELNMPRNWSQEFQLSLRYQMNATYGFLGCVSHQQFSPAASDYALLTQNGKVVGAYYYPGSTQSLTILSAGVYVHW